MLDYVWGFMLTIGLLVGMLNGRGKEVTEAIITSGGNAVQLCIGLLGVLCLWSGLMGIAEKSGLVKLLAILARPLIKMLFPGIPKEHSASGAILMNMAANFFGLGNAATPLGIKAMMELQKLNPHKKVASKEMIMFLVLNTAAIQLIPTTMIALRAAAGSRQPAEIMVPIWFASICATIAGFFAVIFLDLFDRLKNKNLSVGKS